jgi:hypothetical protein
MTIDSFGDFLKNCMIRNIQNPILNILSKLNSSVKNELLILIAVPSDITVIESKSNTTLVINDPITIMINIRNCSEIIA